MENREPQPGALDEQDLENIAAGGLPKPGKPAPAPVVPAPGAPIPIPYPNFP